MTARLTATAAIVMFAFLMGGAVLMLSGSAWTAGATVLAIIGGTWGVLRFGAPVPEDD